MNRYPSVFVPLFSVRVTLTHTHDRHKSPFFYDPAHKLCHMPGLASDEMLLVALLTSASPCLMFPVCYISHISLTASNLRPLKLNNHRAKAKIQMEILQEKNHF